MLHGRQVCAPRVKHLHEHVAGQVRAPALRLRSNSGQRGRVLRALWHGHEGREIPRTRARCWGER
eukprot:36699-Pyramimonas_sp.AAC.1